MLPAPAAVDTAAAFEEPGGQLTLGDALTAALINSPRLSAFSWETRAREAESIQAGVRPNPEVAAELENVFGSGDFHGVESAEATLALSQAIELGGKRGKRRRVADLDRDLSAWDYEIERVLVLAETTRRFVDALTVQEHIALAEELVGVAESTLEAVSRRVEAGAELPVETSRARVELEASRVDLDQLRRTLVVARQQLAATWGSPAPRFSEAVGDLGAVSTPPDWSALQSRIDASPELRRWVAEIERREALRALELARGIPDVSLGAGLRFFGETDDRAVVLGLGLPLPVFDRNRGASHAAELRIRRGEAERRAAAIGIETALASAYKDLAAALAEATALRTGILPEAEQAFATAREAYRGGRLRLTDVLDTERTLFELRGRTVDALARYHIAKADAEQLLGASLDQTAPSGNDE
jgi:cobalt-zinc-cadmium efflux system outer membrane protein